MGIANQVSVYISGDWAGKNPHFHQRCHGSVSPGKRGGHGLSQGNSRYLPEEPKCDM